MPSPRSGAPTFASPPAHGPHGTHTRRARRCTSPTASDSSPDAAGRSRRSGPVMSSISSRTERWHGATADRFMAHVAMQEADEQGQVVTWLDHVTDDEYSQR